MISLQDVSYSVDGRRILDGLTLDLAERRIAVIGANGSGKTSFARLLNGLALPTQGSVTVAGLDTRRDGKEVRRRVGFLFQDPDNQIVMPLVEEDLRFSLKALKLSEAETAERVDRALALYRLEALRDLPCHSLSGGEKQLLALSAVLIREPEYLVLDEPTTLLDLGNRRRFAAAVADLPQPVICVTHDLDLIRGFDRALLFEDGRIAFDGAPADAIDEYDRRLA